MKHISAHEISEERIKKGIENALAESKGYFVGINGDDGTVLKIKFDGYCVAFKIGEEIFETDNIEELELIDRFICCVLGRTYS